MLLREDPPPAPSVLTDAGGAILPLSSCSVEVPEPEGPLDPSQALFYERGGRPSQTSSSRSSAVSHGSSCPWPCLPAPSGGRDVGWRWLHVSHRVRSRQLVSGVLGSFLKIHVLLNNSPALSVLFKCHFLANERWSSNGDRRKPGTLGI